MVVRPSPPPPCTSRTGRNLIDAFAGLLMLADWLGSDTRFFPFANGADPDRMLLSRRAADVAMRAVGLAVEDRRKSVKIRRPDFAALFAVPTPRPIQQHATMPSARCVVLEAETGSGKTEAALWRFVHLFTEGAVDGLYFALPTRVAATQMFGRIKKLRDALFPGGIVPPLCSPCLDRSGLIMLAGTACRNSASNGTTFLPTNSAQNAGQLSIPSAS